MVTPGPNQRQILSQLQSQLRMLQQATRNASMFNAAPDEMLWTQFDGVRVGFQVLTSSLSPWQLDRGANDLAELDAGLGIIAEAFPNFQDDLSNGRPQAVALRTLCQVLRESFDLWERQLNQVASRLHIGR